MGKSWRIAIASTDGKVINEHFGRADRFYVTDIEVGQSPRFLETRPLLPACQDGEHTHQALAATVRILQDCQVVLVARIGPGARTELENCGILVFEYPDFIDRALEKLPEILERQVSVD